MSGRASHISLLLTLAIAAFVAWLSERENRTPSITAEELKRGSATKQRIERILEGIGPHPVGTDAHRKVRDRIMTELRAVGLDPVIERDFVCSRRGACATVENIVARRKGRSSLLPLLVASHYDSVPAGPGAGDAMTAVASMLQAIDELRGVALNRDIIFLIDDGEERGLLGALAYADRHSANEHFAVLNFEARGTSGPLLMFETTQPDGPLVEIYARGSRAPATGSLFAAIYERLPNDTDLTVFRERGFRGLNFAFIGSVEHYHTPLDAPRSLEPQALARYSSELKRAVVAFANHPSEIEHGSRATFFDLFHRTAIVWPSWFDWILTTLLFVSIIRLLRGAGPSRPSFRAILRGSVAVLGAMLLPIAFAIPLSRFLERGSAWLIDPRPALLATTLIALASVLLMTLAMSKSTNGEVALAASSALVLSFAAIVLLLSFPGGSYVVLVPALAAVIHLAGIRSGVGPVTMPMAVIVNSAVLAMLIPAIEDALGLRGLPFAAFLISVTLLPLITFRGRRAALIVAALATIAAMISIGAVRGTESFDDTHPAKRSITAFNDEKGSRYLHRGSTDDLSGLRTPSEWSPTESPFPWAPGEYLQHSDMPLRALLPDVVVDRMEPRRFTMRISSRRSAHRAAVTFPDGKRLRSLQIGGRSLDPQQAISGEIIRVMHHTHGLTPMPFEVVVHGNEPLTIWVEDQAFESFSNLRTRTGVEYQEGDLSIAMRSVTLR